MMNTATAFRSAPPAAVSNSAQHREDLRCAANYPLSRYYLKPLAAWLACWLAPTSIRPVHVTILGASLALLAALALCASAGSTSVAALFVLLAWFCDRLDGELARRQGTVSAWGAWLDANLDELGDLGLHTAIALAAAVQFQANWPWGLLVAFLVGKYLFMYGLTTEGAPPAAEHASQATAPTESSWLRDLYHLPASADVRAHALVLALAWNALAWELVWVAAYYNLRWIVRYLLVARRLRGAES